MTTHRHAFFSHGNDMRCACGEFQGRVATRSTEETEAMSDSENIPDVPTRLEQSDFAFMAALVARADGRIEISRRELERLPSLVVTIWEDLDRGVWVIEGDRA